MYCFYEDIFMFRFLFVSTLMVSTSFTAFAMNNGQAPQTPEEIRKAKLAAIPQAHERQPIRTNSQIGTKDLKVAAKPVTNLISARSLPEHLNEQESLPSRAVSDSGKILEHTRSFAISSTSFSVEDSSTATSSSSTSTSSSKAEAITQEESLDKAIIKKQFKNAIKTLPAHLRTESFKSEYKEMRKRFRTAAFVQSLAWFPEGHVEDLRNFLWGLPELPESIDTKNLVTLINTVRSLFPRTQDQVRYANESLDLLIEGKTLRFVENALRQKADM